MSFKTYYYQSYFYFCCCQYSKILFNVLCPFNKIQHLRQAVFIHIYYNKSFCKHCLLYLPSPVVCIPTLNYILTRLSTFNLFLVF